MQKARDMEAGSSSFLELLKSSQNSSYALVFILLWADDGLNSWTLVTKLRLLSLRWECQHF